MPLARLLPSLAVALTLIGSTHYYIWARLVRDMHLPPPWHVALSVLVVLLGISLPLALVGARTGAGEQLRPLVWVAFGWMGLFFILFCLLLGSEAVRLSLWVGRRLLALRGGGGAPLPLDPGRRLWLLRACGALVAAVGGGAAVVALRGALGGPRLTQVAVRLPRLPAGLEGLTIAQISDLHVATLLGRDYVAALVAQTNALQPSLVAITGDLVDGSVAQLRDAVAPLADLKARHGVYFVTGNHEYYSGVTEWLTELRALGMRVLRNERVAVGEGAALLDLAGIDDLTGSAFGGGHGADLPAAVAGRDPARPLVLLAHQPRMIFEAARHGVDLMLSGHTHGGQIWPFGYLVRLVQPYLAGLDRHGDTQIYVNRGTGYWGPPMRLGAPPELTLLTLRA